MIYLKKSMTGQTARIVGSLILMLVLSGCSSANFYEIPVETPIQPKMDVSPFQHVFVAGFLTGGAAEVDTNLETVRLIRSKLRTDSGLQVIDSDVLSLLEIAKELVQNSANRQEQTSDQNEQPLLEAFISEEDLESYEQIFADTDLWKRIGKEYQEALIVTGTVFFTPHERSGFVAREREVYDSLGRRRVVPTRAYQDRQGFILSPKFIFIDGRTGITLYSEQHREEILYDTQQNTPVLSSYFELMDRLMPTFLDTFNAQKINGIRVLLK